jgi:endoglucanase
VKGETDFTLNAAFFDALDWAIHQSLTNNLMAIVDFHEHSAMAKDPLGLKPKFLACWEQIATHCKNYSNDVLFEIANEPNMKPEIWNEIHSEASKILRKSNPDRTLVIGSINGNQIKFLQDLVLPENDRNIIVSVHYYMPIEFTHQGASWSPKNKDLSGIEWTNQKSEEQAIRNDFDMGQEWSKKHNRPLHLGEFGAYEKAGMASRVRYTKFVAREAEKRNWSWSYWEFNAGFGIFDVQKNEWKKELLEALIPPKK